MRMASKQRKSTAKKAHGAYQPFFGKVVGAKRCFGVPVTVIDVCSETLIMTDVLFGVHFLSTSIETVSTILCSTDVLYNSRTQKVE